ncbi:angiotensin-converting enzyme-like isoform X2 [Stegodyphus dumicola]|nr:angiotensin-converting enzyme-like isoform X2 [Stegodyphus dumicola]
MWRLHQLADWSYSTNVSSVTASAREFSSGVYSNWMKNWKIWAREVNTDIISEDLRREVNIMASGVAFTTAEKARLVSEIKSKLTEIYSSVVIDLPEINVTVRGESEIVSAMATIKDPVILKKLWQAWRVQVGEKSKTLYLLLVQLTNKEARENGYSDIGVSWREEMGLDDVMSTALSLWSEVKSLYKEIHAYTRYKLHYLYKEVISSSPDLIPAHLLGSLWSENWVALSPFLMPFPESLPVNITSRLISDGYFVTDLVHKAEEFYTIMGLNAMTESFWNKSMFEKPNDGRLVDCHAVAYDFSKDDDFRIRMCGTVKEESFMEAIHEMGHIQYFMEYHHLPMIYRNGANSAFHEAVGETMVYAAQSPKCLQVLKLVKSSNFPEEMLLNTLMKQALSKFVFLPWALTLEQWRYMLFSNQITPQNMTTKWWELRKKFQGIGPPDEESSKLFDPGSKYHVINNIPYLRYFLSRFLEHQFLEALCSLAKQNVHSCCFITSREAGKQLKKMLSLGASVSWQEALATLTGKRQLSAAPIMNYYMPLYTWLVEFNRRHNVSV